MNDAPTIDAPSDADRTAPARLVAVVRGGELSPEQREVLIGLLHRLSTAVATAPNGVRRYPDDPSMAGFYTAACWDPVAGGFRDLVARVAGAGR